MSDSKYTSATKEPRWEGKADAVRPPGQGLRNEASILRRRLEFARADIERLSLALATAHLEPTKTEKESAKSLQKLEQELETLRESLESKEKALEDSANAREHLAAELQDRNNEFLRLEQQLQLTQTTRETKVEATDNLETEQQGEPNQVRDLAADEAVACSEQEPSSPASSIGSLVTENARKSVRLLPLIGVLTAATPVVGLWQQQEMAPLSSGVKEVLSINMPESVSQRVSPSTEGTSAGTDVDRRPDGMKSPAPALKRLAPGERIQDRLRLGTLGPTLIGLNSGAFEMGGRPGVATDDAFPLREVEIAPFLIGAYEVTFEDYDLFARTTGRRLPGDSGWGRGKRPVVGVTWWEAQAYVDWLSRQTGKKYRLPTEAEWEYAARAGSSSAYWWGYAVGAEKAVCFDCGSLWDNRSTAPTASFAPNPFGLYDTSGNAMEWVADCYHGSYDGAPTDGSAWQGSGDCAFRVARGGAFNKTARSMRSASRQRFDPDTGLNMIGFRVARDRG